MSDEGKGTDGCIFIAIIVFIVVVVSLGFTQISSVIQAIVIWFFIILIVIIIEAITVKTTAENIRSFVHL